MDSTVHDRAINAEESPKQAGPTQAESVYYRDVKTRLNDNAGMGRPDASDASDRRMDVSEFLGKWNNVRLFYHEMMHWAADLQPDQGRGLERVGVGVQVPDSESTFRGEGCGRQRRGAQDD